MAAGCCRSRSSSKATATTAPPPSLPTASLVTIGAIEKMSKSKKNLVDPDDIITGYGADCARWFMLSDSPPERDVIWTEAGVAGASRFIQRIWRMVHEIIEQGAPQGTAQPAKLGKTALELRRTVHKALHQVGQHIEGLRLQRCGRADLRGRERCSGRPCRAGEKAVRRPRLGLA